MMWRDKEPRVGKWHELFYFGGIGKLTGLTKQFQDVMAQVSTFLECCLVLIVILSVVL